MNSPLNDAYQSLATNSICHAASMAGSAVQDASSCYTLPSVLYRPKLSIDGDQWCALYGDDLQNGVSGFGKSPSAAMQDFDTAWDKELK